MKTVTTMSVVVPATDRPATLAACLGALARSDMPPDEVIVVDEPPHLSAAAARNAGAARASGDVVVFVDADVEVHPDALLRVRQVFEDVPDLSAVFGSYDDTPSHPGVVSVFRNLLHHHVHHRGAGSAQTFWTGLGAIRRDDFVRIGGFDESRYPHPSIEDVDLGDRLHAIGGRILLEPSIQGTHSKRWTLRSMIFTDFARRGLPWTELQLRNRRLSRTLNCGWRHRVSALGCGVGVAGCAAAMWPLTAMSVALLVTLNGSFYRLLLRRIGPILLPVAVSLHVIHHLVALGAVAAGVARRALGIASALVTRRTPRPLNHP